MDPFLIRGIERIISTLTGALLAYLGYRLFTVIPAKTDSKGKIILPGGISIYLSRVGPGVFFALFGAIIVSASFYFGLTIVSQDSNNNAHPDDKAPSNVQMQISYLGAGESIAQSRAHMQGDFVTINRFMAEIKSKTSKDQWQSVDKAFSNLKVISMATVWGSDGSWGSFVEFRKWIHSGEEDPPEKIKKAADFYRAGRGG